MRYGQLNVLGLTNKRLFKQHFQENTLLRVRLLPFPHDFATAHKNIFDDPDFTGLDEMLSSI
jgi:hypothetical protein